MHLCDQLFNCEPAVFTTLKEHEWVVEKHLIPKLQDAETRAARTEKSLMGALAAVKDGLEPMEDPDPADVAGRQERRENAA